MSTSRTAPQNRLAKAWRMRSKLLRVAKSHVKYSDSSSGNVWGSLTEADEAALIDLVKRAAEMPGPLIEVGTLFGFTTQLIASHKAAEQQLIAVESFQWNPLHLSADDHRTFTLRTLRYCMEHANTRLFDGDKNDFYAQYSGPKPSLVFIDAGHRYADVVEDLDWATSAGVALITGHDYSESHPGVIQAVEERFGCRVQLMPGSSVWSVDNRPGAHS